MVELEMNLFGLHCFEVLKVFHFPYTSCELSMIYLQRRDQRVVENAEVVSLTATIASHSSVLNDSHSRVQRVHEPHQPNTDTSTAAAVAVAAVVAAAVVIEAVVVDVGEAVSVRWCRWSVQLCRSRREGSGWR